MTYLPLFKMPKPMKVTGRSSSITNAFINSIIPVIKPSEEEVKEALTILEMTESKFECAYCGATATEWDHLRPLVVDKKPTGYISEISNLVPSCGKCNQSKGNKDWDKWIISAAPLSPMSKNVEELEKRIELLRKYEQWKNPTKLNFQSIVGEEVWKQHWANWEKTLKLMEDSQILAEQIRKEVSEAHKGH